ncbi:E3 ubiquitin-protein ligase RFWD2 [Aphelenchoides besseyi]|nr:E3 ubiquitin-protein ligase RFWD2 [Aphelenchoides besseyi]
MSQDPGAGPSEMTSEASTAGFSGSNDNSAEICRICIQMFVEPYSTVCGHTFCRACISRHIARRSACPMCGTDLDPTNPIHLIPNHTAAALIENVRKTRQGVSSFKRLASEMSRDNYQDLESLTNLITPMSSLDHINEAISELKRRKKEMTLTDEKKKSVLLNEFFDRMVQKRNDEIANLIYEIQMLTADKARANKALKCDDISASENYLNVEPSSERSTSPASITSTSSGATSEQIQSLKSRIEPNLSSLELCYFDLRTSVYDNEHAHKEGALGPKLDEFSNILTGMSQYTKVRKMTTLNHNIATAHPNASIVSSIEFDRDGEYFVVAGVTKKIKLYDFNAVVNNDSEFQYPLHQLQCSSKISNISWNPYIKSALASSDYDGKVHLWDTELCKNIRTFAEHEKRCWTVQFNNVDPHLMASGSDDAKVKLWSMQVPNSICTVDAKVNVCCVYFSPTSRNNFVFGSADHCVHLYDLRNTSKAVSIFRGHRKAVSYVKYCNENEVVSASTDSNLRLWDVKTGACRQIMRGHQNEKNFVGLATDGNHIVCGSENNNLYIYYKNIADPLLRYDFATRQADADNADVTLVPIASEQSSNDFVSAVCWRKNSNIIVAANSQGATHVLELL